MALPWWSQVHTRATWCACQICAANPHARRQLTRWVSQAHPAIIGGTHENEVMSADGSGELVAEAIEVHLDVGDALLFVDCMLHGSARRVNQGERRIFIARCESTLRNTFAMVWQRSLTHLLWQSEEDPCVLFIPRQTARPTFVTDTGTPPRLNFSRELRTGSALAWSQRRLSHHYDHPWKSSSGHQTAGTCCIGCNNSSFLTRSTVLCTTSSSTNARHRVSTRGHRLRGHADTMHKAPHSLPL